MSKHSLDHIHTYVRLGQTKNGEVSKKFGEIHYKCDHPDCYHTAPISLIEGKRSLCSICKEKDFILTKDDLKRAKPRCINCSETKEAVERRRLEKVLGEIGIGD